MPGQTIIEKNNAQGVVVFILTDRQRKERKPDTKNSGQLTKFNYQKMLLFYASLPVINSTFRPQELTNP